MKKFDDLAWEAAAEVWKKASAALQAAKVAEDNARQTLIKMAPEGHHAAGINLIRIISEGRVKYAEIVKELLPNLDTSPWRGEPSTSHRITEDKEPK